MPSDEELGRLKAIPRALRKPLPYDEEALAAKGTLYHQWWRCLRYSKEYLECCEAKGKVHPLAETYANFGDVRINWTSWWRQVGRKIFSEHHDYLKVRAVTKDRALAKLEVDGKNFLILDIPLGLRRETILTQINEFLDEHHAGRNLDVWAQSTARVKLHKSKLQEKTLPQLIHVAEILHNQPDILLYELAQVAGLAEIHLGRSVQQELTKREEHQRREMAASRYKFQAIKLVNNAANGLFPCID